MILIKYIFIFIVAICLRNDICAQSYSNPIDRIYVKIRIDSLYKEIKINIDNKCNEQAETISKSYLIENDRLYGGNSIEMYLANINLMNLYINCDNKRPAVSYGLHALTLIKKLQPSNYIAYARLSNLIGILYFELNDIKEAIRYTEDALNGFKEGFGEKNPETLSVLENLSTYYSHNYNFNKAIELREILLITQKEIYGEQSEQYVLSLIDIAFEYSNIGDYTSALYYGQQSLEKCKIIFGELNATFALALNNLSTYYLKVDNYKEALRLGKKALEIKKELFGTSNPEYAKSLLGIAQAYATSGQVKNAYDMASEAAEILKNNFGENNLDFLIAMGDISSYCCKLDNIEDAIEIESYLADKFKNIYGEFNNHYALALYNLAIYYNYQGNYAEAIKLGTKAMEIRKTLYGINHPEYAASLSALAAHYLEFGDFRKALQLEETAVSIKRGVLGNNNLDVAFSLANIAKNYCVMNNYDEAIRLCMEAKVIIRNILGEKNLEYAKILSILRECYCQKKDNEEALKIAVEVMDICSEVVGEKHTEFAMALLGVAQINLSLKNYDDALTFNIWASDIFKKIVGDLHPNYALSLLKLGQIYFNKKEYSEAIKILIEASNLFKQIYGTKNFKCLFVDLFIAQIYNYTKEVDLGIPFILNAIPHLHKFIIHSFSFLTRNERQIFWERCKTTLNCIHQYNLNTPQFDLKEVGVNSVLLSKGILLNSEKEFTNFLSGTESEVIHDKFNKFVNLQMQINKLHEKPNIERSLNVDSLKRQVNELERQLMQESAEYGDYTRNLAVSWQDVCDNLKDSDTAVEFVSFPLNNDSTMYMAYVLRKDMESPELVKLFEEKDITRLMADDAQQIYSNVTASQLVWGKLEAYIKGAKNVYFAPDGILHQIAIEYLPDIDSDGKISDRYNLYRLSSTREIALKKKDMTTSNATLYGGIRYKTDIQTMENESKKYEKSSSREYSVYYNLADTLALRTGIEYLPFTLKETEVVDSLMKENNYNSTFISGNEATEESFKNLSGKHNSIIHISTHGFYWKEDEADKRAKSNDRLLFMSQFGDNVRRNVEDKALTRTGLFMAGANNALTGKEIPEDIDNGILTAQEIANLDLRGLDLVVLSACKTGMGDISGDGVFGLQRGFKKAGANSILMSLWNVDDEATQILMTEFYKNYLSGMSKRESLLAAQKTVRETPGFEDPEYWAAFILLDALN